MAIAYFIPDQNKLLAAHGPHSNNSNSNNNNNTNNNGNSSNNSSNNNDSSSSNSNGSGPAPHGTQSAQSGDNGTANGNFRANITIPLPPFGASAAHTVGCWDLVTQVFCYALRFYQHSHIQPAAIQISFEFSGTTANSANAAGTGTATPPNAANAHGHAHAHQQQPTAADNGMAQTSSTQCPQATAEAENEAAPQN